MADATKPKLGFVGMGIMGVPMTKRLLAAGYEVVVWNRTSSKCEPAVAAGAKAASTAKEVAESSDITFAMLADPAAALDVVLGDTGVAAGMSSGKGYVDVSTVDSATSTQIAAAVTGAGASFLEAPVSGSKKPAEDGALIFLTAGDEALFKKAVPMLEVMGKAHFFLGEVGKGAEMKLVVNMIMGGMMAAFAEGLNLGEKAGLDQAKIVEVISLGAIASPMFALKGPSMIQGKFPAAFPLKHQQKDLRLALSLGDEKAQELPVAAAANELYKRARSEGHGDEDFSAVYKALKKN
jgi:glyoxylate/succinic semialdehyde reductase